MKKVIGAALLAMFAANSVQAATVVPGDLSAGAAQGDAAQVFYEGRTTIGGGVTVDYTGADLSGTMYGANNVASTASDLAAGKYDSYIIHFDPAGNSRETTMGSYDFGGNIVGLVVSNGRRNSGAQLLNATDAVFGAAGTTYETDYSRRTEDTDYYTLSGTTLSWFLTTNRAWIDNARVLVEVSAVPVPASAALLLAGLGGFAALRRRQPKA